MNYAYIRYTNSRGESVTFTDDFPYMFLSLDGMGGTTASLQTQQAPFIDGSMFVDSVLEDKPLTIEAALKSYDTAELAKMRREVSRVFNPKLGEGVLEYIEGDDVKEIVVVPESSPFFPIGTDNQSTYVQKVLIELIALDPYWKSPHNDSMKLQSYVGNFELPTEFGVEFGVAGSETELFNDGDVPAPVLIEVEGPTTNPQIHNRTTGEFIRIDREIAKDETLYINTTPGSKSVVVERGDGSVEQAFGYLNHDSDMFALEVGENRIEHVADAGNPDSSVILTWQSRYVGI